MGPNRQAQERERAAACAAAEAKRAEAERGAIVDAQKVVAMTNPVHLQFALAQEVCFPIHSS
jgi:hypothetical protein